MKGLNTGETGLAWVDEDNRTAARIDLAGLDGDGPTAELEVLRGDLARLLYEASSADAFYRFGDRIVSVEHDAEGVSVTFEGGGEERFDLLIIAEGVGSRTRELVFPGENQPRRMDLASAFFTVPRAPTDSQTARWYNAVGGRSAGVRPDNRGTTRAFFNVQGRSHLTVGNSVAEQKAFLRASFAGAGWEVPRLLEGMEAAEDFWFDDLRQVKIDRWSNGPVVLLGDAAWCVTPLAWGRRFVIAYWRVCAGGRTHQDRYDCRGACLVRIRPAPSGEKVAERAETCSASGPPSHSDRSENPARRAAVGGNALYQQACCQGADPGGAVFHASGLSIALQARINACATGRMKNGIATTVAQLRDDCLVRYAHAGAGGDHGAVEFNHPRPGAGDGRFARQRLGAHRGCHGGNGRAGRGPGSVRQCLSGAENRRRGVSGLSGDQAVA
ncbi:flavoprotein monooxygenase [Pseudomonas syringae BRIP34881]|nr:flavoprotein monooxygenase [Pseudomonas syringae BRIP34881]